MLILFKLVFGNVNAALKVINASTSSEDVNQLGDVMFNSLLKCVEKATRLDKRYLYTQIRTILTMHRDEFMVLIDSVELGEAQEDFLLPEATRDEISNIVSELFHQYDESINTNDCQTIFRTAIDHFQNEVLNGISEKQGIYLLMQKITGIENILSVFDDQMRQYVAYESQVVKEEVRSGTSEILAEIETLKDAVLSRSDQEIAEVKSGYISQQIEGIDKLVETLNFTLAIGQIKTILEQVDKSSSDYLQLLQKQAFCYEQLEDFDNLKTCLLQISEIQDDELQVLYTGFSIVLLEKDLEEAYKKYELIKKKYSNSDEYHLMKVRLYDFSDIEELNAYVANADFSEGISAQMNLHIAKAYLKLGSIQDYDHFMEKCVSLTELNKHAILASHAYNISISLINNYLHNSHVRMSSDDRLYLEKALVYYEQSWGLVKTTPLAAQNVKILINASLICVVFKEYDKAIRFVNIALGISDVTSFRIYKVLFLYKSGQISKSVEEINTIKDYASDELTVHMPMVISLLLETSEENNIHQALSMIKLRCKAETVNESNVAIEFYSFIRGALYLGYIDFARNAFSFIETKLNNVLIVLAGFLIRAHEGVENITKEEWDDIASIVLKNDFFLLDKAILLIQGRKLHRAKNILRSIGKESPVYLQAGINLCQCYSLEGDDNNLLNLTQSIYQEFGVIKPFVNIYSDLLIKYKDYEKLIEVCRGAIESEIDVKDYLLILATALIATGKQGDVESLNLPTKIKDLSINQIRRLVYIYHSLGQREKLIELNYEIWRNYKSREGCELILGLSFQTRVTTEELTATQVEDNCCVKYSLNYGGNGEFVIYNREDANFDDNREINEEHQYYHLLIGKNSGDTVTLGVNPLTGRPEEITIISIVRNHQYAFQSASDKLSTQYRSESSFLSFSFDSAEEGVEMIKAFVDSDKERFIESNAHKLKVLDLYRKMNLPFSSASNMLGVSEVVLWHGFKGDEKVGIIFSNGSFEFTSAQKEFLETERNICLSISSLLSLYYSGLLDSLVKYYVFHVPMSLLDEIRECELNSKAGLGAGSLSYLIYDDNGVNLIHSISNEELQNLYSNITPIREWIENNCQLHSTSELRQSRSNKQNEESDQLYGIINHDNILIAQNKNFVFSTDDFVLSSLVSNEYSTMHCSSVSLLGYFEELSSLKIHSQVYFIDSNYKFINPEFRLLFDAVSSGDHEDQLLKVLRTPKDGREDFRLIISYLTAFCLSNPDSELIPKVLDEMALKYNYVELHKLILRAISDRHFDMFGVFDIIEVIVNRWFQLKVINE